MIKHRNIIYRDSEIRQKKKNDLPSLESLCSYCALKKKKKILFYEKFLKIWICYLGHFPRTTWQGDSECCHMFVPVSFTRSYSLSFPVSLSLPFPLPPVFHKTLELLALWFTLIGFLEPKASSGTPGWPSYWSCSPPAPRNSPSPPRPATATQAALSLSPGQNPFWEARWQYSEKTKTRTVYISVCPLSWARGHSGLYILCTSGNL